MLTAVYQVVESEEAGVLSEEVGAEVSPAEREQHTREGLAILGFNLYRGEE